MVAAEQFTPSGRPIPDARRYMGLGPEGSLDVYTYESVTLDELKRRWMPAPKLIAPGIFEILGSDVTDQFSMVRLEGKTCLSIPKRHAVTILLAGEGLLNGRRAEKGVRFFLLDEPTLDMTGENMNAVICY